MYFELPFPYTDKDLKTEFRRLSLLHHPDIIGGDGEAFREIVDEYDAIRAGKKKPNRKIVKRKINKWKFYEFFNMDTETVFFYLDENVFREGATMFLMEKATGQEVRINLPPNSKAPMESSFEFGGRKFKSIANVRK